VDVDQRREILKPSGGRLATWHLLLHSFSREGPYLYLSLLSHEHGSVLLLSSPFSLSLILFPSAKVGRRAMQAPTLPLRLPLYTVTRSATAWHGCRGGAQGVACGMARSVAMKRCGGCVKLIVAVDEA
jgi:hypothetical protein